MKNVQDSKIISLELKAETFLYMVNNEHLKKNFKKFKKHFIVEFLNFKHFFFVSFHNFEFFIQKTENTNIKVS